MCRQMKQKNTSQSNLYTPNKSSTYDIYSIIQSNIKSARDAKIKSTEKNKKKFNSK